MEEMLLVGEVQDIAMAALLPCWMMLAAVVVMMME
jgi:hypothetical protein